MFLGEEVWISFLEDERVCGEEVFIIFFFSVIVFEVIDMSEIMLVYLVLVKLKKIRKIIY